MEFYLADNVDYVSNPQEVTLPVSSDPTQKCFSIAIIDDDINEGTEEFLVLFQIPFDSDAVTGEVGSAYVHILDDDGKKSSERYFFGK